MAKYNAMSDILATDLIKALWDDARREDDPARKAQLERDAAAMEDVWSRSKYALAPTRDQMTAALGNASLNLADTLSIVASEMRKVTDRVAQIHTDVQNNDTLVSTFIQSFQPQFESFQQEARAAWEDNGSRLKKLESGQASLAGQVNTLSEEMSDSKSDQKAITERLTRLEAVNDRLDRVEAYIAGSRRAEVDILKAQVEELSAARRKYTPEQIQVMTDALPRMIADWLAAHPDEAQGDGTE